MSTLSYRPGLDGLRAVAVSGVLLSHVSTPGTYWAGGVGVSLFFALSGFLITALLADEHARSERVDLVAFYRRRARRLLPAIALVVTFWLVAGVMLGENHVIDALAGGSYAMNWLIVAGHDFSGLNNLWSLAIEEQFYLLWPLLFLGLLAVLSKRAVMLATLLLAGVSALLRFAWVSDPLVYYQSVTRAENLLIGCAAGMAFAWGLPWRPSRAQAVIAALVLAWFVPTTNLHLVHGVGLTLLAMASVVVVLYVLERPGWLAHPVLVYIGRISYGLYLWHYPVVILTRRAMPTGLEWGVASITLTLALSILSYELVERRFLAVTRTESIRSLRRSPGRTT